MMTFKYNNQRHHVRALLLAAALLLWPTTGLALEACTTIPDVQAYCTKLELPSEDHADCDSDGYTDYQECKGFTTVVGTDMAGYLDSATDNFNPAVPDLVYFISAVDSGTGSLLLQALGDDPNGALSIYSNDLKIRTHRVEESDCGNDRLVSNVLYPRAAWIKESTDLTEYGDSIGYTKPAHSIPSETGVSSTIYTAKIKNQVDENCSTRKCSIKGTSVTNGDSFDNTSIINYYILQVMSHEMGHGSWLANTTAKSYYHYRRSGTIMDPAAKYSKGVYDISAQFDVAKDPDNVILYR